MQDEAVRAAQGVRALRFDGGFLLLDPAGRRVLVHDRSAEALWREVEQGLVAAADAGEAALIETWREAGLLAGTPPPPGDEAPPPLPPLTRWAGEWVSEIGGRRFSFAVEHERGLALVRTLLAHLEAAPGPADFRFEVRDSKPDEATLLVDGEEILRTGDAGLVLGAIYQQILVRLHGSAEWMAVIHGGAAALGSAGIGFPATSGSGKTTLVAGLVARGFRYLADDLLAVRAPGGEIVPWPMPQSIKAGSWDVVSRDHPALKARPTYITKGMEAKLLMPGLDAWTQPPVPMRALVFPRYERGGGGAALTRIAPLEALSRLINDRVWIGHPITEARLGRFLDWLSVTPAWELRHDDLGEAAAAVRKVVEESAPLTSA